MTNNDDSLETEAFAFPENPDPKVHDVDPVFVQATDGIKLAVRVFGPPPNKTKKGIGLVFYHGGGAHSAAGYQFLAQKLASDHDVTVYLPDLRGHGESGGPRGDAPCQEQVWEDVESVLKFANKHTKLFLGGHSSGGGLVVNYATGTNPRTIPIAGYVLVAPQLGYLSGTARPSNKRSTFASVNIFAFVLNGIFGIMGHSRAVKFAYPERILEQDPRMVAFNTVNMANAITPSGPSDQFQTINNSTLPVGLWIGANDEIFVPDKVTEFVPATPPNVSAVVPEATHLGILFAVHDAIGDWLTTTTTATKE